MKNMLATSMAVLSAGLAFGDVTVTEETAKDVKYTIVTGGEGDEIAVSTYGNTAKTIYRPGAGGTIKLTPSEAAAFLASVDMRKVAGGDVTIAVETDEPIDELRWQGSVQTSGKLTVTGAKKVVFGGTKVTASSQISMALFWPGEWPATNPEVVFTNAVNLARNPLSAWSIAAGTMVGVMKNGRIGTPGEEYVLGTGAGEHNHGLLIAGDGTVVASVLRIKPGVDVGLRTCSLVADADFWRWAGATGTLETPIVLDGETAELKIPASNDHTLTGDISGNGILSTSGTADTITLLGDLSNFTGYIKSEATNTKDTTKGQKIYVDGDFVQGVRLAQSSRITSFSLRPSGYKTLPTAGRVDALSGVNDLFSKVWVVANNTLTVGELTGKVQFNGDATSKVIVESLAAGAIVRLVGGVVLQVKTAGAGAQVVLGADADTEPGSWQLFGPETGSAPKLSVKPAVAGGTLAVGGQLDLGSLKEGFATLTLYPGKLVASVGNETTVSYRGGTFERTTVPWQDKVALWCDADSPGSFVYCKDCNSDLTNLADNQIFWWHDRRPDQVDYCLAMSRFSTNSTADVNKNSTIYPKVVAAALNGKPCVSLADSAQKRMGILAKATKLNNQAKNEHVCIPSKFAIVVGRNATADKGSALLCTYDGRLDASKKGSGAYIFTNETLTVWKNGTKIDDYTKTTWGSDWAIYSFTTDDARVNGITTSQNPQDNRSGGGFEYAEILVFTSEPTETERMQIEAYLSEKWGIEGPQAAPTTVLSVGGGDGKFSLLEDVVLRGTFAGTVDLSGRKLTLADGKLPYADADVPSDKRQFWFDPTVAGAVHMGDDAAKPDEIKEILPRDADGVDANGTYYLQSAIGENGLTNRRPRLVEGSRGGAAAKWIDFADGYADGTGNNLMFRACPVNEPLRLYTESGWLSPNYKTIFVVTDTSRGGGTPFGHYAGMTSGDIRYRGIDAAYGDPIWKTGDKPGSNGCMPIITNGQTWLDGVSVDGTTHGFSGRPEVMSFMPAEEGGTDGRTTTSVKGLACPGDVKTTKFQKEILSEIIAYNRYLTDEERVGVETYLMKKWLGKLPEGYADFRSMTVTGAGELTVPSAAAMPKLGADFTGSVSVATNELSFSFAANATRATDALDVGEHALTLPATMTINLLFASRVKGGQPYVVMVGDLTAETTFVLGTVTGGGTHAAEGAFAYDAETKTVSYTVPKVGGFILLR